jgi:type III secretion system low calcium response chaperone LcrH/SycD
MINNHIMDERSDTLINARQEVRTVVEHWGNAIPPRARPIVEDILVKMKVNQLRPGEAIGFTPNMMEIIYEYGYHLFQAGKFQEALPVFDTLRELDPIDHRYSFAIAACYHYSKDYLNAAANYILDHTLDPSNPISCFHLYDCFVKANYPLSALQALVEGLILAERDPQYAGLATKMRLELEGFKGFLTTYLKENNKPQGL